MTFDQSALSALINNKILISEQHGCDNRLVT